MAVHICPQAPLAKFIACRAARTDCQRFAVFVKSKILQMYCHSQGNIERQDPVSYVVFIYFRSCIHMGSGPAWFAGIPRLSEARSRLPRFIYEH